MQSAIIDQINAEIGIRGWSYAESARQIDAAYDSTRNYLIKERAMPLDVILAFCRVLNTPLETFVARARERL